MPTPSLSEPLEPPTPPEKIWPSTAPPRIKIPPLKRKPNQENDSPSPEEIRSIQKLALQSEMEKNDEIKDTCREIKDTCGEVKETAKFLRK